MNSFDFFVISFSGLLVVLMINFFISEFSVFISDSVDSLDLINVINVYNAGVNLNAVFSAVYFPVRNGTLIINDSFIFLNNASLINPGFPEINCCYDFLLISNEGVSCA